MKILTPIGSKERFLEMFQGVNKLNEGFGESQNPIDMALDALINGNLSIEQVNNQVSGDESIVEISGTNGEVNATFKFKVHSSQTDQEGVNSVDGADLIYAKINDNEVDENSMASINANRQADLIAAISEYVEFESDTATDEMFEDAVKFIDNVPYNKGSEEIQTQKAYADQKPTNPELRVQSPELDKFVSEIQDYVPDEEQGIEIDPTAMPPEYGDDALPNPEDDGSIGVDPYDSPEVVDDLEAPALAPEKAAVITQAYENLVQAGNPSPTMEDIAFEGNRMQGIQTQPVQKTRTIPRGAEEFYESTDQDKYEDVVFMQGEEADEALEILRTQGEDAALQHLMQWHDTGNHMGSAELGHGSDDQTFEKDGYIMSWSFPLNYIGLQYNLSGLSEDEETYPKQMGKKFKPKNQMPKKKKKHQNVVKLTEKDEDEIPDGGADSAMMGPDSPSPEEMSAMHVGWADQGGVEDYFEKDGDNPEDVEQVMQAKDDAGDELEGGLADDNSAFDFCPKQIAKGMEVEMEHTDNPLIAIEIVMDHLVEDPKYYGETDEDPEAAAQAGAQNDAEGTEDDELTDELLGFKPHNVGDYAGEENEHPLADVLDNDGTEEDLSQIDGETGKNLAEEEFGYEEYQGNVGDRYADAEGNEFSVRDKTKGGVTLKGQGGEKEVNTGSLTLMKNLGEAVVPKEIISEEQIKTARQALNNRGLTEGMSKKEAIQLLIKHNIK